MNRSVFHIRLKNFEIEAERLTDRTLRTRAVALISSNKQNGTVTHLSNEAALEGLRAGMQLSLARRMAPSVQFLNYNKQLYSNMHHTLFKTVASFSPVVEPSQYGQYYLDMTGMDRLYKSRLHTGEILLRRLQEKVEIAGSLGISSNKLVSRLSTLTNTEPVYEVSRGNEPHFMSPLIINFLPVSEEQKLLKLMHFMFIKHVYDLQNILKDQETALTLFGRFFPILKMQANGVDHSTVCLPKQKPHINKHHILSVSTNDIAIIEGAVQQLAEQLGYELRLRGKVCHNLLLEVRYDDGFNGSAKAAVKKNDTHSVNTLCLALFHKANYRRNRIRSIMLDASNFIPAIRQGDLFSQPKGDYNALSDAVDRIRNRFGGLSIKPANTLLAS